MASSRDGRGSWRNRGGRGPPSDRYFRQGGSKNYSSEGPSGSHDNWNPYDDRRKRGRQGRDFSPRQYDNYSQDSSGRETERTREKPPPYLRGKEIEKRNSYGEGWRGYSSTQDRYNDIFSEREQSWNNREQSWCDGEQSWNNRKQSWNDREESWNDREPSWIGRCLERSGDSLYQGGSDNNSSWGRKPRDGTNHDQFRDSREQFSDNHEQFKDNREQFMDNREQFRDNRELFRDNCEQFRDNREYSDRYRGRGPSPDWDSQNWNKIRIREEQLNVRGSRREEQPPQYRCDKEPELMRAGMKRSVDESFRGRNEDDISDDEMPGNDSEEEAAQPPIVEKKPRKKRKRVKPIRVFVKGLPMDFLKEDINTALRSKGFKVRCCNRFKPLQVYHVQLTPTPNVMDVFNVKEIAGNYVSIVEPKTLSNKQKFLNQVLPSSSAAPTGKQTKPA